MQKHYRIVSFIFVIISCNFIIGCATRQANHAPIDEPKEQVAVVKTGTRDICHSSSIPIPRRWQSKISEN